MLFVHEVNVTLWANYQSIYSIHRCVSEAALNQPKGKQHHKSSYCPLFFSFSHVPSDEIQLERPEFNSLILTSVISAPEHNRDSPDPATASFPLSIPKSPATPDPLHGRNDHSRDRCFVGKEGEE